MSLMVTSNFYAKKYKFKPPLLKYYIKQKLMCLEWASGEAERTVHYNNVIVLKTKQMVMFTSPEAFW